MAGRSNKRVTALYITETLSYFKLQSNSTIIPISINIFVIMKAVINTFKNGIFIFIKNTITFIKGIFIFKRGIIIFIQGKKTKTLKGIFAFICILSFMHMNKNPGGGGGEGMLKPYRYTNTRKTKRVLSRTKMCKKGIFAFLCNFYSCIRMRAEGQEYCLNQ